MYTREVPLAQQQRPQIPAAVLAAKLARATKSLICPRRTVSFVRIQLARKKTTTRLPPPSPWAASSVRPSVIAVERKGLKWITQIPRPAGLAVVPVWFHFRFIAVRVLVALQCRRRRRPRRIDPLLQIFFPSLPRSGCCWNIGNNRGTRPLRLTYTQFNYSDLLRCCTPLRTRAALQNAKLTSSSWDSAAAPASIIYWRWWVLTLSVGAAIKRASWVKDKRDGRKRKTRRKRRRNRRARANMTSFVIRFHQQKTKWVLI